jgi:hypothetical protein
MTIFGIKVANSPTSHNKVSNPFTGLYLPSAAATIIQNRRPSGERRARNETQAGQAVGPCPDAVVALVVE